MKIKELFEGTHDDIAEWMWKFAGLTKIAYNIDKHGFINVPVDKFALRNRYELKELPYQFGEVTGAFSVRNSSIESLYGIPKRTGGLDIGNTKIASLIGIEKFVSEFLHTYPDPWIDISFTEIKEGGIGIILIPGLKRLIFDSDYQPAFKIIQKYLGSPEDLFECQAELIDKGFEAFAKL